MEVGGLVFHSNFDSGNLARVTIDDETKPDDFTLYLAADCEGSVHRNDFRSWFYFTIDVTNKSKVSNSGRKITLTVVNLGVQNKLFENDFRPVFTTDIMNGVWDHVNNKVKLSTEGRGKNVVMQASWSHVVGTEKFVSFAMSFPFTYEQQQQQLEEFENACDGPNTGKKAKSGDEESIYFFRETLTYSLEGRKVDLLTISGFNGMLAEREDTVEASIPLRNPYWGRPHRFEGKRTVVLMARVHPGESPSSFVLHGVLQFLFNRTDPRAIAARKHFVFKIIPMLNPDGVFRGHYRTDSVGQNLNRMYDTADTVRQPTIYAARQLLLDCHHNSGVACFLDIHAHASRRGCFVYGNFPSTDSAVTSLLFPRLMTLNSPHFDFSGCNFTDVRKGSAPQGIKDGTGRVAITTQTGLIHSYTLEVSYNTGTALLNQVAYVKGDEESPAVSRTKPPRYTPTIFMNVGKAAVVSILDMYNANPITRLAQTPYHNLSGLQQWMEKNVKSLLTTIGYGIAPADEKPAQAKAKRSNSLPYVNVRRSPSQQKFHRKGSTNYVLSPTAGKCLGE